MPEPVPPGIPGDVDVFAPFVTTKQGGTGLGLAVSRQIGGRLTIRNHPYGGAVAELDIPPEQPAPKE